MYQQVPFEVLRRMLVVPGAGFMNVMGSYPTAVIVFALFALFAIKNSASLFRKFC